MELSKHRHKMPEHIQNTLDTKGLTVLRPCQIKAVDAGLFQNNNLLICTPTGSGKTLVAEMAALEAVRINKRKAVYIVPLKALAMEKYRDFKGFYGDEIKVALSIGDTDSSEPHLAQRDIIVTTSEKLDSLIRHHCPWLQDIGCVIVDEVHLLNDPGRGPTLEILLTMLRSLVPTAQIVALSATIGNPKELATWLGAELVIDTWRPVALYKGIYQDGEITFYDGEKS